MYGRSTKSSSAWPAGGNMIVLPVLALCFAAAPGAQHNLQQQQQQLSLSVLGPGRSADQPAFGVSVQLAVGCGGAECPPWVKIERTTLVHGVTRFPATMHNPAWGPLIFTFGSSADHTPISFVAAGWSAEYNGTRLTANSTAATVFYDVGYSRTQFALAVQEVGPASVRLQLNKVVGSSLPPNFPVTSQPFDAVRFDRFLLCDAQDDVHTQHASPPPQWCSSYFYHQESADGSLKLTFQQPGIYYYAALPSWQGRDGGSTARGADSTGKSHPRGNEHWTRPTALVVRGADGRSGNQSLPVAFAGDVHELTPLVLTHQFCIIERNLTAFSGSQLRLPLCQESLNGARNPQPAWASVVAPSWLLLQGQNSRTCRTCPLHQGLNGAFNSSSLYSTAQLPGGLVRYTFHSQSARWSRYNDFVPLYITFDASKVGALPIALQVMIHANPSEATDIALAKWQTIYVRAVKTPSVPLAQQLVTSLTWTDRSLFLDDGSGDGYMGTYRRLGFNTVPYTDMVGILLENTTSNTFEPDPANPPPAWYYASGRTGSEWNGLRYGPEGAHGPGPGDGPTMCKQKPEEHLLPAGLSETEVKEEMAKWQNAHAFYQATGQIDIAYEGIFFRQSVERWCSLLNLTQPDWIWLDDECYGQGWSVWSNNVALSSNAQARAMPQEKQLDLAWRMAAEVMMDWMSCVNQSKTTVAWYGNPFPDRIFSQAGISMTPSSYGPMHYLQALVTYTRGMKQHQAPMKGGKPRRFLPWLTACTYGQLDAVDTFEGALHSYGAGATGFSFFLGSCLDDPAKVLALSSATALASPFEDHFLKGEPMVATELTCIRGNLRAWSGMSRGQSRWIVLSPGSAGRTAASNLVVRVAVQQPSTFSACDLTTGQTLEVTAAVDGVEISLALSRTSVVHVAPDATTNCPALPSSAWLPVPGYNY